MHTKSLLRAYGSRIAVLLLAVVAAGALGTSAGIASAAPTPPSSDPFYSYAGALAGVIPGTVLRTRQVEVSVAGTPQAYPATQVLYRTTDQLGQPSATAATIIRPLVQTSPTKLLSYQTFYDGVASTCRPSYTLQGGDPSNTTASVDEAFMLGYLQQGFTIVTSDYEGPTDDYGAGRESGYGTLDAIRAAEHQLGLEPKATPVGLVGYSGGAIASEWASELKPGYAPDLDLIGVAEAGIPVDFAHNLSYIDGSADWAGAIPAVDIGLARAYRIDLDKYLSPEGEQVVKQVEQGCLNPTAYPGLTFEDMLKPQYKDWKKVAIFVRTFNDSIMGRSATPNEPLLMGVGDADGTGDGVMIAKDVQELAYTYCQRQVPVQFNIYNGDNHDEAIAPFEAQALQFLQARYGGQPFSDQCSSLGPGNPLTPLATPAAQSTAPRLTVRMLLRVLGTSVRLHGLVLRVATNGSTLHGVTIELVRHDKLRAKRKLAQLGKRARRVVLRVHGHAPAHGHGTIVIKIRRKTLLRRAITIRRG